MNQDRRYFSSVTFLSVIIVILIGIASGLMANLQPLYLVFFIVAVGVCLCFFASFEKTLLGLLILRSTLDAFSDQQVPAAFAIGLNILAVLYILHQLLSREKVHTDGFWWFLVGWVVLQGLWVILLPLGGLGASQPIFLSVGVREWIRVSAGLTVYLLIMQLKDRCPPQRIISLLFYSLIVPLIAATLQVTVPPSKLPSFLVFESGYAIEAGSRMNGTLGHPNVFATFIVLFIGLTLWKIGQVKHSLPWLFLLGTLVFFLVKTQSLTGLMMFFVFIPAFLAPKLNAINFIGGILLFGLVLGLFTSSDLGHERLQSLYGTPLLNPDISMSRAILLQWSDGNSFNWRIAQWNFLLDAWRESPLLGHGLDTSRFLTVHASYAHNDYVRFLAEEGIVGFGLFLVFLVAQFVRLIQLCQSAPARSPKRNLCYVMMAFVFSMAVAMLAGNVWNHTTLFFYYWTLMAVLGWNWECPKDLELAVQSAKRLPLQMNI